MAWQEVMTRRNARREACVACRWWLWVIFVSAEFLV